MLIPLDEPWYAESEQEGGFSDLLTALEVLIMKAEELNVSSEDECEDKIQGILEEAKESQQEINDFVDDISARISRLQRSLKKLRK